MKKLLSNQQQRHLSIIEILNEAQDTVSLAELATKLKCSIRTLYDDIEKLSDFSHIFVLKSTVLGISIKFHSSTSVNEVFHYFMQNSISFNLLKLIFFEDFINRDDLCNQLYISRGTLTQILRQVNPILEKYYHFKINTAKLTFVGEESEIRSFFLRFFYDSCPLENWQFDSIVKRQEIFQFMKDLYYQLSGEYNEIEIYQLCVLTLINSIRLKNGYLVDIPISDNFHHISSAIQTIIKSKEKNLFQKIYQINFNLENFIQVAYPYMDDRLFLHKDYSDSIFNNNYCSKSFLYLENHLPSLAKDLNIMMPHSLTLIRNIHNSVLLYPFNVTQNKNLLCNNSTQIFYHKTEFYLPIHLEKINLFITDYLRFLDSEINTPLIEHLVLILLSYWESIFLQLAFKNKTKIGIITNLGHNHSKMLRNYFQNFFGSSLIEFIYLKDKIEINNGYALIISNFEIPINNAISNIPQLSVHDFPTKDDIRKIQNKILDIIE